MPDALLETVRLSKDFGGLHAVRDVDLAVEAGRIHAVIGPNGAGKTTLVRLLSGALPATRGTVRFNGMDITGLAPHRVARLGIGRCDQKTSIFPDLTCLENCWLGARPRTASPFAPGRNRETEERAHAALAACGLERRAQVPAAVLSHGERKELEIAVTLAGGPRLLLLDEPLAGMGAEESERMTGLVRSMAGDHTVVLIEHDMDAVFALADRITVMVDGAVLATGSPDEVRADARVQEAYLGHGEVP